MYLEHRVPTTFDAPIQVSSTTVSSHLSGAHQLEEAGYPVSYQDPTISTGARLQVHATGPGFLCGWQRLNSCLYG